MTNSSSKTDGLSSSSWKAWAVAFRLKTISASLAPVLVAFALSSTAAIDLDYSLAFFAVLSAFLIQMGTNLTNDAVDYRKGADDEKRIGPVRLIQRGLMTADQVHGAGIACFLLAILAAVPLMWKGGLGLVAIIFISCLCGYFYTAGRYSLAYTGMADFFVLFFFGLVLTSSVVYLETGEVTSSAILAGLQMGLLATTLLAINNLRDTHGDARVNKKTLAVRFGKTFGRAEITLTSLLPFLLGTYWLLQGYYLAGLLPFLAFPLTLYLVTQIWKQEPGPFYNKLLGIAGLQQLLFSFLLSFGFFAN